MKPSVALQTHRLAIRSVVERQPNSPDFKPLTHRQHLVIAQAEPKTRGRVVATLLP